MGYPNSLEKLRLMEIVNLCLPEKREKQKADRTNQPNWKYLQFQITPEEASSCSSFLWPG
jgi:hypothetical protein